MNVQVLEELKFFSLYPKLGLYNLSHYVLELKPMCVGFVLIYIKIYFKYENCFNLYLDLS